MISHVSLYCKEFELYAQELRQISTQYIRNHLEIFQASLLIDFEEAQSTHHMLPNGEFDSMDLNSRIEYYLKYLSLTGSWAGEQTIYAVSELLHVRICIVTVNPENSNVNIQIYGEQYGSEVILIYRNFSHYNSVEPEVNNSQISYNSDFNNLNDHNGYGMCRQQLFSDPPTPLTPIVCPNLSKPLPTTLLVGTWNVRGVSKQSIREKMDDYLQNLGISIIGIQETKSTSSFYQTTHYKWYLSSDPDSHTSVNQKGVGVLIHKSANIAVLKILRKSNRLICIHLQIDGNVLIVFSIHIPPTYRSPEFLKTYKQITHLINSLSDAKRKRLLLLGDFNGYLGKDLFKKFSATKLLGTNLYHTQTNESGEMLFDFITQHALTVSTTFGRNSAIVTRHMNGNNSQLDHLLISSFLRINGVKASFLDESLSDHKLVWGSLIFKDPVVSPSPLNSVINHAHTTKQISLNKKKLDSSVLISDKSVLAQYQETVLKKRGDQPFRTWKDLSTAITFSANQCLTGKLLMTPRREKAQQAVLKAKKLFTHNASEAHRLNLQKEKSQLKKEWERFHEEECVHFFKNLSGLPHQERLKRTFKYIRTFRRKDSGSMTFIPISSWNSVLNSSQGPKLSLIAETDQFPLLPPPCPIEIEKLLFQFKNGKAPGNDKITMEMMKGLPSLALEDLICILQDLWVRLIYVLWTNYFHNLFLNRFIMSLLPNGVIRFKFL